MTTRRPQLPPMRRPSFAAAVEWLALNAHADPAGDQLVDLAADISVCLIADLFGRSPQFVADAIRGYRRRVQLRMAKAAAMVAHLPAPAPDVLTPYDVRSGNALSCVDMARCAPWTDMQSLDAPDTIPTGSTYRVVLSPTSDPILFASTVNRDAAPRFR